MINIGNKRELFFDNYLIDTEKTSAESRLHKPQRKGVVLDFNMPWETNLTTMITVIYAEGKWRMYYIDAPKQCVLYAESDDAENWVRPELGIVEFEGSTKNNILISREMFAEHGFVMFDNMSVTYDENPECPADEKYKMVGLWCGHASLALLTSADGLHFDKCRLLTDDGEFDSQNRLFWSAEHKKYFAYFRGEHDPDKTKTSTDYSYTDKLAKTLIDPERFLQREPVDTSSSFMRDIKYSESYDCKSWTPSKKINTTGIDFQLYNNCIFPYPRAPHVFVGLTLRYVERKAWTKNYDELCGKEDRIARAKRQLRFGLAVTDGIFMASRDGYNFTKYDEAILPPPPENPEAFVYGDGTMTPALIEVPSEIPGADNEYMILVRESFRTVQSHCKLVKYTIRLDGFVSMHAGGDECELVTKEFAYDGENLYANIATSARGYAYFTLKSGDEEYTSCEMFGNSTDKRIRFEDDEAVKKLSGKPVTLTVKMFDADLYSIRFGE